MADAVNIQINAIVEQAVNNINKVNTAIGKTETATQKTGGGFKEFTGKLNGAVQQFTGLNLATLGWIGAAVKVVDIVKKSVDGFVQYSNQMQDISRLTGESVEDMSRLVQVGDDVRLTYDQMKTAMQIASRQGIDVSIDGIKKLSDEYLALQPGLERSQFLLKTFGRSGAEMGRLLEMGSAGIDKATASVAAGLIMDEKAIAKAEKLRLAKDALSDSLTALGNILAGAVIPAIAWLVEGLVSGIEAVGRFGRAIARNIDLMGNVSKETVAATKTYEEYTAVINGAVKEHGYLIDESGNLVQSFEYQGQVTYKLIEANYALSESQFKAAKDQEGLNQMVSEGIPYFGALGTAADSAATDIEEMAAETWSAADAFDALNKQQIFNVASAGLDREAQLALAQQMGLLDETALRQLNTLDQLRQQFDDGTISALEYNIAVANLDELIKGLQSKDVTINTFMNEYRRIYYETGSSNAADYGDEEYVPRGGGGAMRPGQWFKVGEMGNAENVRAGYGGYVATTNNYTMNINSNNVSANDVVFGFRTLESLGA